MAVMLAAGMLIPGLTEIIGILLLGNEYTTLQ